jgi:hypothetical protein
MATPITVDSLIGSEFQVELDGQIVAGVFHVAHLVTLQFDAEGKRVLPPFELAKMVHRDAHTPFNQWLSDSTKARHTTTRPTRTVTIKAVDDGVVTRTWTVSGAFIQAVRYSNFDVASFKMVEETYTIGYADIEDSFSA